MGKENDWLEEGLEETVEPAKEWAGRSVERGPWVE